MPQKLPNAKIVIPVTASSVDSDVVCVQNLFMFPDKKQQLLNLCSASKIRPLDIKSDMIQFQRKNAKAVIAYLVELGTQPFVTKEADLSSLKQFTEALQIKADYNGRVNLELSTPMGDVNLNTSIEINNLDDADAVKLIRVLNTATEQFKKPMDVTVMKTDQSSNPQEALVPYVDPEHVETLRESLNAAMDASGFFSDYFIMMDRLPVPHGVETKKLYSEVLKLKFANGHSVKLSLNPVAAPLLATGDVLIGPHPMFLPLHAGILKYAIDEVTPDTITFTVSDDNKTIKASTFKFTREQFTALSNLYSVKKQSVKAFNVQKKEFIQNDADQKVYDAIKSKPDMHHSDKVIMDELNREKAKDGQFLPEQTRMGDKVSKDHATSPPQAVPAKHVSASPETPLHMFQALGLW